VSWYDSPAVYLRDINLTIPYIKPDLNLSLAPDRYVQVGETMTVSPWVNRYADGTLEWTVTDPNGNVERWTEEEIGFSLSFVGNYRIRLEVLKEGTVVDTDDFEIHVFEPMGIRESICSQLTESTCAQESLCYPSYGPSHCHDGKCTADSVYKGCKVRREEGMEKVSWAEYACKASSGVWSVDGIRYVCSCPQENQYRSQSGGYLLFDETGCISFEEMCRIQGATLIRPEPEYYSEAYDAYTGGNVASEERCRELDEEALNEDSPYTYLWNEENGTCDFYVYNQRISCPYGKRNDWISDMKNAVTSRYPQILY